MGQREMASQMADEGPSQPPPPSSYGNGVHLEGERQDGQTDHRLSYDIPPSYRSVDEHADYEP